MQYGKWREAIFHFKINHWLLAAICNFEILRGGKKEAREPIQSRFNDLVKFLHPSRFVPN
jgi:hypothetical protein